MTQENLLKLAINDAKIIKLVVMSIRCKSCGKDIPLESVKNMNSDNINIRQVELDEFKKGILSGEIKPHDVDIIIRYKDGKEKKKQRYRGNL